MIFSPYLQWEHRSANLILISLILLRFWAFVILHKAYSWIGVLKNHTALLTLIWILGLEVQDFGSSLWLLQNLKVSICVTWQEFT